MANTGKARPTGEARPRRSTQYAKRPPREGSTRTMAATRRSTTRRLLLPLTSIGIVVAVTIGFVASSLTSGGATASEGVAPPTAVNQATHVSLGVLNQAGRSQQATALRPVADGSPLFIDAKAGIVFVSEESCPFCAAERWPVVIALSHFGTWHHLGATTSSSTDVYPSTATFSFRNATFDSRYLAVRTTELADSAGRQLQPVTPLDTELINHYDVPPYVNSADQTGAVPFLDIDNHDVLAGAQYNPQLLAGLSVSQIAAIDQALHLAAPPF
jgi:hypothetical protein